MADLTLTAPIALIKQDGVTIGKAKNITVTENFNRGVVMGIGALTPSEVPALSWSGKVTMGFYAIKWNKTGLKNAVNRNTNSPEDFVNTVLLQEKGLSIVIFTKGVDVIDPATGIIKAKLEENMTVTGMFNDSESLNISENQIAAHDQTFTYINPVLVTI